MKRLLLLCSCLILSKFTATGESPEFLVNLGPTVGIDIISEDGETSELMMRYEANAFLTLTDSLEGSGRYTVSTALGVETPDGRLYLDREYLRFVLQSDKLRIEAGLLASLLGSTDNPVYANPDLHVTLGEITRLSLTTYLLYLPDLTDDLYYLGARLSTRIDPSIFLGFELSSSVGGEFYYEYPVLDSAGNDTGATRSDLIVDADITVDGMIGFFSEWAASAGVLARLSNATYFLDPDFFSASEDRVTSDVDISFFTSPHQSTTIDVSVYAEYAWYLARKARTDAGLYGDANLWFMDSGAGIRVEWTPHRAVYLVLKGNAGYSASNDPFVCGWDADVGFSVEFAF